jgi:hypothetical protein
MNVLLIDDSGIHFSAVYFYHLLLIFVTVILVPVSEHGYFVAS